MRLCQKHQDTINSTLPQTRGKRAPRISIHEVYWEPFKCVAIRHSPSDSILKLFIARRYACCTLKFIRRQSWWQEIRKLVFPDSSEAKVLQQSKWKKQNTILKKTNYNYNVDYFNVCQERIFKICHSFLNFLLITIRIQRSKNYKRENRYLSGLTS